MRITMILIVCILMSGCGLFRKTTKIDKSSVSVSTSSDVKVTTDVKVNKVEKATDKTITSSESDDQVKVYPKPGTEVKIAADGSMTLEADSIISNTKKKTNQARDLTNQVTTNLQKKVDSIAAKDSTANEKSYKKAVTKKPSAKGIFSNWIGGGVVLIGLIAFLLWYFGIKPKKKK
ncbi:hypothetical protein [Sphingobacterium sp. JUb56]|uniref:hypothetical protein n=1 Tax=Sphingobacterium sp. JUb56 TaxID=2587145 RepID=UPI001619570F|nr:hypothetical protein [Sphingobacterium sp. JUb56]MBB2951954.1 hypothetical protein [Sphingobacterium sp. JUb56]